MKHTKVLNLNCPENDVLKLLDNEGYLITKDKGLFSRGEITYLLVGDYPPVKAYVEDKTWIEPQSNPLFFSSSLESIHNITEVKIEYFDGNEKYVDNLVKKLEQLQEKEL